MAVRDAVLSIIHLAKQNRDFVAFHFAAMSLELKERVLPEPRAAYTW
jgi:hypothetical protein